jgi:hypothetical protein
MRAKTIGQYFMGVAVGLDQLGNAILCGDVHWTISARAYIAKVKGKTWGCVLCSLLDKIQKNHCFLSYTNMITLDQVTISTDPAYAGSSLQQEGKVV